MNELAHIQILTAGNDLNVKQKNFSLDPLEQPHFLKIALNFSACLEKIGEREKAIEILSLLKEMPGFETEHIKLDNNIAVLNSRKGNWDAVF